MFFELWSSDRWKPFASFYFPDVSQAPKIMVWSSGQRIREPKLLGRFFLFQKFWKQLGFSSRGILNYGPPITGSLCFTTFSILPQFYKFCSWSPDFSDESWREHLKTLENWININGKSCWYRLERICSAKTGKSANRANDSDFLSSDIATTPLK